MLAIENQNNQRISNMFGGMNKAQEILFENLGTYGIMDDKPCKLKFNKKGNSNINIASLYPSVYVNIDESRIVDQYKTEEGWIIEI